ncbi:thiamine phosphate synthase [Mucilaginibacter gynuensis]
MMKTKQQAIAGGIYLVINPAMDEDVLLNKLTAALRGGLQAVQLWDNWAPGADKHALINKAGELCQSYDVPLLINNDWQLLIENPLLNGIHFDEIPDDIAAIRAQVSREFIAGITCSDDLLPVTYANENSFDYISFCAMFPSPSAGSCSIVMPETVRQARALTAMPLFVSGGITPANAGQLKVTVPFDGIAVISGIMSADDPEEIIKQYKDAAGI